jgi:hypothetical protein
MSHVEAVVEQMELVVGLAEGQIPDSDLEAAARRASEVRERVGHLGSTVVLALVGGTGVGKSSLLNALAGERVASTGILRPHTTEPLAWIPANAEPALAALLDELRVERRVEQGSMPGIAILDMTDVDSVESEHRRIVEAILPAVDLTMWVLDPVKYGDADLHRSLIAPTSGADRLLFALNRIDTVAEARRPAVLEHLAELLAWDGVTDPVVFAVAADPPTGPPVGVERVIAHLRDSIDEKRVRLARVVDEARRVGDEVARAARIEGGGSTGFDAAWSDLLASARSALGAGITSDGEEALLGRLERLVAALSAAAGPVLGPALRGDLGAEVLEAVVSEAADAARAAGPEENPGDVVVAVLDQRVGDLLREALWGRARLAAAVAGLAVEARAARERLG